MKNVDFFHASDFIGRIPSGETHAAALVANKKLNNMIESWPVVILVDSGLHPSHNKWVVDDGGHNMSKFIKKARLAFIEEIKKEPCKHEPNTYETSTIVEGFMPANPGFFHRSESEKCILIVPKCKHCGIELQATWSEKK